MDLQKLLSRMTLRQKAAQLTQFNNFVLNRASTMQLTGGQASFEKQDVDACASVFNILSPEEREKLQNEHIQRDPNHIPMVVMQDVIHGFDTIYPIPLAMAASFDPALYEEMTEMAAKEASAAGIDVTFAPMVDLSRDARWGRVMEGAGEDVYLGCEMAAAQVRGFKKGGLECCVKHYAAYGAGEGGREYNTVDMSEQRLRERYLPPYKAALDAGASCIMPSFNSLNGVPSVANRFLMNRVLRQEWGFDGLVVSDFGAVGELISHGAAENKEEAAFLAMKAGCDLEMMSDCYVSSLEKLVEEGRVTEEEIDRRVLNVLRYKEKLGLLEHPAGNTDAEKYHRLSLCDEHREKARRAAAESAVLLKNDGLLPLDPEKKKVAVIGPFADDGMIMGFWAVNGKKEQTVTVLSGVREYLPQAEVTFCPGCSGELGSEDLSGIPEAAELASRADQVILVLGESGDHSGEGQSRAILSLSPAQKALFEKVNAACQNTAVVLMCGRPLAIPELAQSARAILCMWQPGTEGGHAAADLLFGKCSPCGCLPMSFPRATGQEPLSYDMYNTGRMPADPFHSENASFSSHWMDCPVMPLYPFGYGLSYTAFEIENEVLDQATLTKDGFLTLTLTLRNTGKRDGKAVVQLYIHDIAGSCVRPVRQLKAFRKVFLKAGEAQQLTFRITEEMLRFETLENGFASEKGRFEVIPALNAWSGRKLPFTLI